jgi:hypothetical protein
MTAKFNPTGGPDGFPGAVNIHKALLGLNQTVAVSKSSHAKELRRNCKLATWVDETDLTCFGN